VIIWRKGSVDSETDWVLVDENSDTEVIASIIISENSDDTCNVEAVCGKIGYTCRFDHLDKVKLKTVVPDLKKTVLAEIHHLRDENIKPTDRKIYKMIDSIPVWIYLRNGAEKIEINLNQNDYGKFAEILGNKVLHSILQKGEVLVNMFPEIEIISVHFIKKFKVFERSMIGLGDIVLEVDYKKDGTFGKKIVIFEIKHGKIIIEQNQLRRYCSMILEPGEYFHKSDEVKIIYMIFDDIDTLNASAFYSIKEIDKDFARKVLEQEPVGDDIYNSKI
jgi:hypothetical protein